MKSVAFTDPATKELVIHIVNVTKQPTDFKLSIKNGLDARAKTFRTSGDLSDEAGEDVDLQGGRYAGKLQPREMLTLQLPDSNSVE